MFSRYLKFLFPITPFYVVEGGDDDTGGGAADDGAGDMKSDDRVTQLEQTLTGVVDIVKNLATGHSTLQASIQQLSETLNRSNNQQQTVEESQIDDTDLETMSRKDLIALINQGVNKQIKESLNPLNEQITGVSTRLEEAITSVTVKDFQANGHPDLMEWKTEIADLFKAGRAATVADAYVIARTSNPDKAKTIDAKYAPVSKKSDSVFSPGFKGFPPSGGSGSGKNTRMTQAQAAEAAWAEATAAMPGIEQFLTDSHS